MDRKKGDIIAAISTPIGKGAIGCIRVSGEGSAAIAEKLTGIKFTEPEASEKYHARMVPCTFKGRVNDRIMAVVYYGDKSFTGEESAEFYMHGGVFITEQGLLSVIDSGARLAEAGEFTRRAFLNGKIDLTQAEGISGLIDGESPLSLEIAYEQSEGKIKKAVERIYAAAVNVAAKAEVCIDYPEEDIEEQSKPDVKARIEDILSEIDRELDGYEGGRIKREGVRVVIAGKVNAGKSTLFNTLLGENRAIVCDEEGTTRDTIEEKTVYRGLTLVLADTAGVRETDSRAEKLGIERTLEQIEAADIVVNLRREGEPLERFSVNKECIEAVNCTANKCAETTDCGEIMLNAATGYGKEALLDKIYETAAKKFGGGGSINNARQYSALSEAKESLLRAITALDTLTLDCVCTDLRAAIESVGKIIGKNTSEEVIREIFSHFCVGK